MIRYDKKHDVRMQQGKIIEDQLKVESRYPGGREQMIHDEILAHRKGKLFIRPSNIIKQ
jgi:hypothetical protein